VKRQILRSLSALRQRFGNEGKKLSIDYLLYCPDYQAKKIEAAGLAADRIVDARQHGQRPAIIQAILPAATALICHVTSLGHNAKPCPTQAGG